MTDQQDTRHRRQSDDQDVASSSSERSRVPRRESKPLTHLVIGRVVAPRGVRGELRVAVETQDPERFTLLREVYLGRRSDDLTLFAVRRARVHQGQALLELAGIEDRETADPWRGAYVYIHVDDALPLEEGEYYVHQIEGLTAVTEEGQVLGLVKQVLPTGANDVYVIDMSGQELLLPAIKDVILRVDLEAGQIVVRIPEGLP